jgi:hypothetical protein
MALLAFLHFSLLFFPGRVSAFWFALLLPFLEMGHIDHDDDEGDDYHDDENGDDDTGTPTTRARRLTLARSYLPTCTHHAVPEDMNSKEA